MELFSSQPGGNPISLLFRAMHLAIRVGKMHKISELRKRAGRITSVTAWVGRMPWPVPRKSCFLRANRNHRYRIIYVTTTDDLVLCDARSHVNSVAVVTGMDGPGPSLMFRGRLSQKWPEV